MCKYKTKPETVDADQFLCELDKEPKFIPNGVYNNLYTWGVDGVLGFINLNDGDWVVKYSDSKYYKVFPADVFHNKFEKSVWQN